ncbi:peptidylprolyl isomerase [Conexibacter woesei]|uniref:PpiC-type peptidyl-prolyl cis-trans isomerase n=1 Tax=Conexibacter woesei (strain DSM 14684 / CCUG 47730 / CIP 108061 / JCM 11494 / NBRC 100937 / ID131577) TaxID=469383 RepID=D3F3D5_CONWI|nr:peptidylprolyl isomerase [Conexibacter woesei]ADB50415.1 PpiC-type peptidyl-prolyl cis-trans isomerase [Conexibacter woesei DSM 14684]
MAHSIRAALTVGALVLCPLAVSACGGDDSSGNDVPSNAIASVDGTPVTKAEYEHLYEVNAKGAAGGGSAVIPDPPSYTACAARLARQAAAARGRGRPTESQLVAQCRQLDEALRNRSVAQLVQMVWLDGETERLGIEVTDADVERAKRATFPRAGDMQRTLRQLGMTERDVEFQLRFNQLSTRLTEHLQRRPVDVGDAEISAYYARNREQFAVPERRDLELILTRTETQANDAKRAVEGGTAWAAAARRWSTDELSKGNGGRLLGVARGQQDRALDAAAFDARRGVLLGPVRGQFGWYLVRVTRVTPSKQSTLAESSAQIRELVRQQESQRAMQEYARTFQESWTAKTNCRRGFVIEICANAPRPRTTSTAGGGVATAP